MSHSDTIAEVARLIQQADSLLFITGAGLSADSGLPTYRGVGGLYDRDLTDEGLPIETALSGPVFARRPEVTWKYLWQICSACVGAAPNAAHRLMARLESQKPNVWVLTQNVDGLHRAAGSTNLVEVHGHAFDLYCSACGRRCAAAELFNDYEQPPELPPVCAACGGVVRPDVVLFEEALPAAVLAGLRRLAVTDWDVVLAVGTSALFPYIAAPIAAAHQAGKPTVEINPSTTIVSHLATHGLRMGAAEAAEAISARAAAQREA